MRYILMHRTSPKWEAGARPSLELVTAMGGLIGEMMAAGAYIDGGGLRASALGVRVISRGGTRTVTPGPFVGRNELVAGFAIIRVTTLDEAVAWAGRFADLVGDVEIDIRPVTEPWDIGVGEKPEGLTTTRYMLAHKADARTEAGKPGWPEAAIQRLADEMTEAGVLLAAERLQPSSTGVRFTFAGDKHTVVDGPFAETKELIAGYMLYRAETKADALRWAHPFAAICGDLELDIRPLYEAADLAALEG